MAGLFFEVEGVQRLDGVWAAGGTLFITPEKPSRFSDLAVTYKCVEKILATKKSEETLTKTHYSIKKPLSIPDNNFFDSEHNVFVFPLSGGSIPLMFRLPGHLPPTFSGFRGRLAVQHFVTFEIRSGAHTFASSKYFFNIPPTHEAVHSLLPRQMTLQPAFKLHISTSIRRKPMLTITASLPAHHFSPREDIRVDIRSETHIHTPRIIEAVFVRAFGVTTGAPGVGFAGEEPLCDRHAFSFSDLPRRPPYAPCDGKFVQKNHVTFPMAQVWRTAAERSLRRRVFPFNFVPLPAPGSTLHAAPAATHTALFFRNFRLEVVAVLKGKQQPPMSLPFTLDVDSEFIEKLTSSPLSIASPPFDLCAPPPSPLDDADGERHSLTEPHAKQFAASVGSLSPDAHEPPSAYSFDESFHLEELIRF
eukprot:gnl/Chilomastix_cuspidata/2802.p1 GENE.gnl/Chilomastix_cuspidata/2802~~gnl/Chilomastix_cuspidata/2802.p1  ORF type:complete len:418 (-),score=181.85 gnl/Chilomastix_cuspidata/2802:671-1924(-)